MKVIDPKNTHKVKFVYYDLEGNIAVESTWALKEGEYYRIKNIPFFAPNIAFNDLIKAEHDGEEIFFEELIGPSGNSTIQIVLFDLEKFEQVTNDLMKLGCDWEGSNFKNYISVDVPHSINYAPIRKYLQNGSVKKWFDFKEACLSHKE
jgi:hypothetical protein